MTTTPAHAKPLGEVVLALDIGTSSTRCLAFDKAGRQIAAVGATREYQARATPDGGSELDADALATHSADCLAEVSAAVHAARGKTLAIGVCTFWHAFVGVDAAGKPVTPVYLWNDNRAGAQSVQLRERLDTAEVHRRTGCVLHPSYLPARLLWLQQADPVRYRQCARFLSPGEYLEQLWFGESRCGLSMASGTGLLNQSTRRWDDDVMAATGLTPRQLSSIHPEHRGRTGLVADYRARFPHLRDAFFFPALGDGACSNVGSGATDPGQAALMVGTSAAMRVLLPGDAPPAPPGLWRYLLDGDHALIGGALSNGGNLHAWMRDTFRLEQDAELEARLAAAVPGGHGLTVLPFLAGERNPDYPLNATGMIAGLRLSTTPFDLLQAGMEAVAFRLAAIAERLRSARPELRGYLASGGLLKSPAWLRMITDVLGMPVTIAENQEASARGAALMALQGIGVIPSALQIPSGQGTTILPDPRRQEAFAQARERHERVYGHWKMLD